MTLLLIPWAVVGIGGFVYWWTSESDLTVGDAVVAMISGGILGPLAWLVGWELHGKHEPRVIVRKRT